MPTVAPQVDEPSSANHVDASPDLGETENSNHRAHLSEALAGLATGLTIPSPALPTTSNEGAAAYGRPNRVAITAERFLAGLQPKIEKAAEAAILAAVAKHLDPALQPAGNSNAPA